MLPKRQQIVSISSMKKEKPPELIPIEDYYLENGRWVFTEAYHRKRGYCCESACRHCPWAYKKESPSDKKNK
jgi:Family of unknown function (DUF5522)